VIAASGVYDPGKLTRQLQHTAVRCPARAGHHEGCNARVKRALDWTGWVGILVSVKMNVAVYHSIFLSASELVSRFTEARFNSILAILA